MIKNDWVNVFKILEQCLSDFNDAYPKYQNGKNKQIRKSAESNVKSSISLARLHVEKNPEVLGLISNSRFGHIYAYDEFWETRYFGRDMYEFLIIMKEHINSL